MEEASLLALGNLEKARRAAGRGLCDFCLGRLLGKPARGGSVAEQGRRLRAAIDAAPTLPKDCSLCEGLCAEFDTFADRVRAALEGYEFESFLIGSVVAEPLLERERELAQELSLPEPFPLKQEINREVGLRLEPRLGKRVDFKEPDIVAVVDTRFDTVKLQIRSAYFRGRYRKLKRGIPQTRWPCRSCRGRGCKRCGGTGKMYADSVEEYIAGPLMETLGGDDHALHGAGREDIDARMLGRGRPFAVEVRNPRRRAADLEVAARSIAERSGNAVEVEGLSPCTRADVVAIKEASWTKSYRVLLALEKDIKDDQIHEACVKLSGTLVDQQTPTRVAHRRADKVRRRRVERVEFVRKEGTLVELTVTGESGLYVKELVNGDHGRTMPSLSGILGVGCEVCELDVTEIHDV